MKKVFLVCAALLAVGAFTIISTTSCTRMKKQIEKDLSIVNGKPRRSFYMRCVSFDVPRFPLRYPFEMTKPIKEWLINVSELGQEDVIGSYGPIDRIYCDEKMIYAHNIAKPKGCNPDLPDFYVPERWFTIDMDRMHLELYSDSTDFYNHINEKAASQLRHPDFFYSAFDTNVFALPWIPDTVVW